MRLLRAARRVILEQGRDNPVGVRLSEVVRSEGLTTGAAYQIWRSQEEFHADVALHIAEEFDWAGPQAIMEHLGELLDADATIEEAVRSAGNLYIETFIRNDEYYTVLQLYAVHNPTEELLAALQRGYDVVHTGFAVLFEGVLGIYGRRIRDPFTIDDVAVIITALTEGIALRAKVQPDVVRTDLDLAVGQGPWHVYSATLAALTSQLTEPIPAA
ncbi:MAG: hypothetical protein AAF467_03200 [Actinomycetota bacterium]